MGITSPLLKQAGFVRNKIVDAIYWVAKPDGLSQCWVLTDDILVQVGDVFTLSFFGGVTDSQTRYFIGDPNYQFGLFCSDGVFTGGNVNAEINGIPIILSTTQVPTTGNHTLRVEVTKPGVIRNIGARDQSARINLALYDFSLSRSDVVISKIDLSNREQGSLQLASVGGSNAYMPNYTDAIWKDRAKL